MTDISHQMGSDLDLSPSGDLLGVSGPTLTRQRVLRRLLTNPGAYIWHLAYGGGLPRFVGRVANKTRIKAVILRQMKQESAVGGSPAPTVSVNVANTGTVSVQVSYADQTNSLQQIDLSF